MLFRSLGAVYGLPLVARPLPSVPETLGRSRSLRPWTPGRHNGDGSEKISDGKVWFATGQEITDWYVNELFKAEIAKIKHTAPDAHNSLLGSFP